MFKIATLLQACLGLHHPEIYPILVLMHSRFKKGVLPIIRLPAEAIKFAPAYFFAGGNINGQAKWYGAVSITWRSRHDYYTPLALTVTQHPPQPFSIQEHLTIRNWQCKHITKINRITVYPFIYKRVNRYIRRGSLAFSREPLLPSCRPLQLHSNK